ncbi:MAG: NUDIX domain-containing protein [Bacteroidaceae bacterium]|nr:NUDIX domain-containing protein [Bacteroidaceae bacterium]
MNKDNDDELLPRVDNNGKVIGVVKRGEAHCGTRILHPVVHLHLFNSKGELYLQLRPEWKPIQPNKWDTACGGHIEYGEEVEEALKREVSEELGLTSFLPKSITKYVFEGKIDKEFVHVFMAVYDGEVKPSATELAGGRFFSKQEIQEKLGTGFFTPNFEEEYNAFLKDIVINPM